MNLAMKAAMCQHRGNAYDPCNQCVSCQSIGEAREDHWGLVSACSGSGGNYFRVDGGRAKASNLDDLLKNALFEEVTTLIVLDEALGLVEQGLERRLLKSIDESPCIWIVVAIKAMAAMKKGRVQGLPGLLPESRLDLAEKILKPKTLADIADPNSLQRLQAQLLAGSNSRRQKPRSNHTVRGYMNSILAALNWAHLQGWLPTAAKIRKIKTSTQKVMKGRPITTDEFELMLKATPTVVGNEAAQSWVHVLRGLWTSALRLDELMHVS